MKYLEIKTRNDLADYLGIQRKTLTCVLYHAKPESFYESFLIPKKDGSTRQIDSSTKVLKTIQSRLTTTLWNHQKEVWSERGIEPHISQAFQKGKSIITNAEIHRNKRFIYNFDLQDFFGSIHFGRVAGFFEKNRDFCVPKDVAIVIAQLVCYKGSLPQGAPSSPIISNLVCQILDSHLLRIARQYRMDYTRYADDLTFSTNDKAFLQKKDDFYHAVVREIISSGFEVNTKKTRLVYKDSRQIVTGLVVNQKINIPKTYYKNTRAMLQSYYQTGQYLINGEKGTLNQLEGRLSYIYSLEKYNNSVDGEKHKYGNLSSKEKLYRDFLFYRYFLNNSRMIIVTEGKTDILYLKAALKKYYLHYSRMITKGKDGSFRYNISFFRKSERWKALFGMSQDGASGMKSLYNFFVGKNQVDNIWGLFKKRGAAITKVPVVFLFDNECKSESGKDKNKKPLQDFVDYLKLTPDQGSAFRSQCCIQLNPDVNLNLITLPLPEGKEQCEMEDLFTENTLATEIAGRYFSRTDEDRTKYYNKDIFSRYIYQHYDSIDFSGFKPLLNLLNQFVT